MYAFMQAAGDPKHAALHAFAEACQVVQRKMQLVVDETCVVDEEAAGLGSKWVTVLRS